MYINIPIVYHMHMCVYTLVKAMFHLVLGFPGLVGSPYKCTYKGESHVCGAVYGVWGIISV